MTSLLDRLGNEETKAQKVWSWFIQDRTRKGSTITSLETAVGSATIDVLTGFTHDGSTDLGYLIDGDVIRLESGVTARVSGSTGNGGFQQVTLTKVAGGNWTSSDIAVNDAFGHSHSSFPEYSDAPNGRVYTPDEEYNAMTTIRRSFSISGDEFTNKTYLSDGKSWYFEVENIEMKELAKDKEDAVLFGELSTGTNKSSRGILDYALTYGVNNGFAAATGVSETDMQDHITDLLKENVSNNITVLCGAQFLTDAQRALKEYAVGGGTGMPQMAGLDFQEYKFMGKTIRFVYYELFNDPSVVPTPVNGIGAGGRIDFDNFSLWLDMGSDDSGNPLIKIVYKELDGQSRKFIHAYETGMMSPEGENGGKVSNGKDGFTIHYLIECGVEVRLPNRLGILRATS